MNAVKTSTKPGGHITNTWKACMLTASAAMRQAKYDEAESLYEICLDLVENNETPISPDIATTYIFLARLYEKRGMHGPAEVCYWRAVEVIEQLSVHSPDGIKKEIAKQFTVSVPSGEVLKLRRRASAILSRKLKARHWRGAGGKPEIVSRILTDSGKIALMLVNNSL